MEEKDRNSINTIGIVLIVGSTLMIFGNSLGAALFIFSGILDGIPADEVPLNSGMFIMVHYVKLCIGFATLGVFFLTGGIFLRNFKLWANRLISIASILLILFLLYSCIMLAIDTLANDLVFTIMTIAITIAWSIPFGILFSFLNKTRIKALFA